MAITVGKRVGEMISGLLTPNEEQPPVSIMLHKDNTATVVFSTRQINRIKLSYSDMYTRLFEGDTHMYTLQYTPNGSDEPIIFTRTTIEALGLQPKDLTKQDVIEFTVGEVLTIDEYIEQRDTEKAQQTIIDVLDAVFKVKA